MNFSIFVSTIEIGPPFIGPMAGLRRYTYSLIQALANQDIEIHIATTTKLSSDDDLMNRENIHFYFLPEQISARGTYSTLTHFNARNHRKFSKQAFDVFTELSEDKEFALIHAMEVAALSFAIAKKKEELNIPLVVSVHGAVTTGNLKSRLWVKRPYSKLLRKIVKFCDYNITNSMSHLDKIKRLPKKTEEKTILIHHAINCKKFSQIPKIEDTDKFRDKYDLPQDKTTILLQGPYITRKSQYEIIDYFPEVLKRQPKTNFLIIGDGPLLTEIKAKIVNLKIDDSTRITGYIKDEELNLAYHVSNILLYPAREGCFGTPLIEAMASGLPVIAMDRPPMNEMLPPDIGWLYPPEKKEQIVDKILQIIQNKKTIEQITFKSQNHALKHYDYSVIGKALVKNYKKIIKQAS